MTENPDAETKSPLKGRGLWIRLVVLVTIVAGAAVAWIFFKDQLTLDNLAEHESTLRRYKEDYPVLVYGAAFVVYVIVTGLSLPVAAPVSLFYGWYFGLVGGVVLVSFASTTGATLAFLLSRYLFRDAVASRFGKRLETFDRALAKEGPFFLFVLRLIPYVPFWLINLLMGLTPMRVWTFWWVSQLGMLPGTIVYIWAGSSVPSLQTLANQGAGSILTWDLVIAFILLGTFPLIVRFLVGKLWPSKFIAVAHTKQEPVEPPT